MAFNIRRVGTVAPDSVGETELKDGAVSLSGDKVSGELPGERLEDNSVLGAKIKDLEINTNHIKNLAITAIKAQNDVKLKTYIGDESEVYGTLNNPYEREFHFVKSVNTEWSKLRVISSLKSSSSDGTAVLEIFINDDSTALIRFESNETDYKIFENDADISYLLYGKHKVTVKLYNYVSSFTAYSDFLDVGLIP